MLAPALGRDALLALVNAGSFCIALAFFGVSFSLLRLRRDFPDYPRPFKLWGGRVIPYIAAFGSLVMIAAMVIPSSPAALSWPVSLWFCSSCSLVVVYFGLEHLRVVVLFQNKIEPGLFLINNKRSYPC